MSWLSKVFELNWKGLNFRRALVIIVVLLLPLIVLELLDEEQYWLSVSFGALWCGLNDPGGAFLDRLQRLGVFGLIGALLTLLGFAIGDQGWGLVALAAFVVTLVGGLAVRFGVHRFVAGLLLNAWFIVAIGLPTTYALDGIETDPWTQALAWLAGSALWIAFASITWLARGRGMTPAPVPEIPGDTAPRELTRPVILFALIRAVAVAAAVAFAFGLELPNAYWMPIATIVAIKPTLQQSALVAEQRLAGAILGATVAALFLLTVDSKPVLEVVVVLLFALAGALRTVNYAVYCAAIAGCVLIAMDLPHPSDLGAEGERVLYTFIGVGIGVAVMFVAKLLQKRTASAAPQTTQTPQGAS